MQSILEWMNTNKEWAFSGIGVLIVAGFFAFWRGLFGFVGHWIKSKWTRVRVGKTGIDKAKATSHILFIDDDVKFKVVEILKNAGWHYTSIVKDVTTLHDDAVTRANILFIDINGVGKKLGFKDEGLGLALALKNRYPEKKVVIYSADTRAERFHEAWKKADEYLAKNADPYEFQQIVEQLTVES
jgi:Ni,Fe-hydrogenase maturation factor